MVIPGQSPEKVAEGLKRFAQSNVSTVLTSEVHAKLILLASSPDYSALYQHALSECVDHQRTTWHPQRASQI
jgi:hypothetical protein